MSQEFQDNRTAEEIISDFHRNLHHCNLAAKDYSIVAPAKTADEIIAEIEDAMKNMLEDGLTNAKREQLRRKEMDEKISQVLALLDKLLSDRNTIDEMTPEEAAILRSLIKSNVPSIRPIPYEPKLEPPSRRFGSIF